MPEETAKHEYKLYALPADEAAIKYAASFRFYRICAGYALIYKKSTDPVDIIPENMLFSKKSVEITPDRVAYLTQGDIEWLTQCIYIVLLEEAKRNEKQIIEKASQRLEQLEQALQAEHDRLSEDQDGSQE